MIEYVEPELKMRPYGAEVRAVPTGATVDLWEGLRMLGWGFLAAMLLMYPATLLRLLEWAL